MLTGFARATAKALDLTLANPAAAVLITWKMHTESRPKEANLEKALEQGLSRLRKAGWTNPKTNGKRGLFLEEDWKALGDFSLREKRIAQPVPTSRMYTNDLIDEINNYDGQSIIQQARSFDLKSLQ